MTGARSRLSAAGLTPTTLLELQAHIRALLPGLKLDDPERPVVLLADIGDARRTLASDADVQELFCSDSPRDDIAPLEREIEVREIFPITPTPPRFISVSAAGPPRLSRSPASPQSPSKPSAPPKGRPAPRRQQRPASARAGSSGAARPAKARAPTTSKSAPVPAPQSPSKPDWQYSKKTSGQRPLSAPHGGRRESPPGPPAVPRTPRYDGRPGQRMDKEWAGRTATKAKDMSTHMLDAFGILQEYETLKFESGKRGQMLKKLLEMRENKPGTDVYSPDPQLDGSAELVASPSIVMAPRRWECGEFSVVAERDVAKVREAIAAFEDLENAAVGRLRDDDDAAMWRINSARSRLAEEKRLSFGRPQLIPKKVMHESSWLAFGDEDQALFRIFPQGDGSAKPNAATIFAWLGKAMDASFTFTLCIGSSLRTAPRLWQAGRIHYRMDVSWTEIAAMLLTSVDGSLDIRLQVLQWHQHGPSELEAAVRESTMQAGVVA